MLFSTCLVKLLLNISLLEFVDDYYFYRFTDSSERRGQIRSGFKESDSSKLSLKSLEYIAKEFETHVFVDDRRYHLKTYRDCFIGHEAVSFLLRANFAPSRPEAVVLGRRLAKELDLFEHVTRQHEFKDDFLFYRFIEASKRKQIAAEPEKESNDFSSIRNSNVSLAEIADYFRRGVEVKTHTYRFKAFRETFIGNEAVDFLVNSNLADTRRNAVALGRRLADELDLFHHVKHEHEFKDDFLFYRFADDGDGSSSTLSEIQPSKSKDELLKIAKAMRQSLKVKNRRWYHKVYADTFLGEEAVSYLVNTNAAKTREEAIMLGRELARQCNLFEHVEKDHELKDQRLFYRFLQEESKEGRRAFGFVSFGYRFRSVSCHYI